MKIQICFETIQSLACPAVMHTSMLAGHGQDTDPLWAINIPYAIELLLLST